MAIYCPCMPSWLNTQFSPYLYSKDMQLKILLACNICVKIKNLSAMRNELYMKSFSSPVPLEVHSLKPVQPSLHVLKLRKMCLALILTQFKRNHRIVLKSALQINHVCLQSHSTDTNAKYNLKLPPFFRKTYLFTVVQLYIYLLT